MKLDWQSLQRVHPRSAMFLATLKRLRTKVGFVLAAWCVVDTVYTRDQPFHLLQPNAWAIGGLLLVVSGLLLRVCALGYLRKKEFLATKGVYSLCRHPLYLGSILLAYGFCVLMNDLGNFVVATAYFFVFYSLALVWEESRLAQRYGEIHRLYREKTPLLMPLGRFEADNFRWRCIKEPKTITLVSAVMGLLIAVEVMAEAFK